MGVGAAGWVVEGLRRLVEVEAGGGFRLRLSVCPLADARRDRREE